MTGRLIIAGAVAGLFLAFGLYTYLVFFVLPEAMWVAIFGARP